MAPSLQGWWFIALDYSRGKAGTHFRSNWVPVFNSNAGYAAGVLLGFKDELIMIYTIQTNIPRTRSI